MSNHAVGRRPKDGGSTAKPLDSKNNENLNLALIFLLVYILITKRFI